MVKEKDNLRSLIIVESPGKIKTIKKILGGNFEVKASMGHVIDLPERDIGVDVKNNFEPKYEIIPKKDKVIEDLQKEVARRLTLTAKERPFHGTWRAPLNSMSTPACA